MTREKILETFKDYVMTLRSPNIKDERIRSLISERSILLQSEVEKLDLEDRKWLDDSYFEWFNKEIVPLLSRRHKKILKMVGYFS